jgi:drug/metabolite transporter (DMT)-like permease
MPTLLPRAQARFKSLPAAVRGAAWMTLSSVLFSCNAVVVRHLAGEVHPFELAFFRAFFGVPLMLPWLLGVGLSVLRTRNLGIYVVRGSFSALATVAWFMALALIPVADATAISFTTPIFASIAAAIALGEAMHARRWTAVAVSFAGVAIILRPGFETINLGTWLVLASALFVAVNSILVKTAVRTDTPDAIAFWQILVMVPMTLIPAIFFWRWPTAGQWVWVVLIAVISTVGHRALGRAYLAADVSMVQPFDFTRLPFAVGLGWLAFAELPDLWTWIGGFLIFAASAFIAHREARTARRRKPVPAAAATEQEVG